MQQWDITGTLVNYVVQITGYTSTFAAETQDGPTTRHSRTVGHKYYELSNHLGNVLATVSDRKLVSIDGGSGSPFVITGYVAEVLHAQDFAEASLRDYPFGMAMPGRSYEAGAYRFGFQGQETDNEVYGTGNAVSYKYRVEDPRVGRFLSIDPLASEYPWNSPYAFSENRVIDGVELEGLEYLNANDARVEAKNGKLMLKVENFIGINRNIWNNMHEKGNWKRGELGISSTIGSFSLVYSSQVSPEAAVLGEPGGLTAAVNPTADVTAHSAKIEGELPLRKSDGKPNMSHKVNKINAAGGIPTAAVPRVKAAAGGLLALDILNASLQSYKTGAFVYDAEKIKQHTAIAQLAAANVQDAISLGMIPPQYLNPVDLSNITNVVLQGKSDTGNPAIFDIGIQIYNTISVGFTPGHNSISQDQDATVVRHDYFIPQAISANDKDTQND